MSIVIHEKYKGVNLKTVIQEMRASAPKQRRGTVRRYTLVEEQLIRKLWLEGLLIKQIAFKVGRTARAISTKAFLMKLPRRHQSRKVVSVCNSEN